MNVNNSVIAITTRAAKNLPSTIATALLGAVINICSVPFFLSSAKVLIVRSGIKNITIYITE